ncbi:MAG TPA: class I SAM-dependent methyltransferase [Burkholderiales bacterium]|nr:class I SAM-dependent methyltransferase [Burkholderiales bacterium]
MKDGIGEFLSLVCELGEHRAGRAAARAYFDGVFAGVELAGRRVLDIGGGNGMHSYWAALQGAREVVCLEPEAAGNPHGAARELAILRRAMPELPVRFDARPIQDFADGEGFDAILMLASINHLDEQACIELLEDDAARESYRAIFTRIAALARPGATLVITDCCRHNLFPALGLTNPFNRSIEWHKHQQPETWAELLAQAGFAKARIGWLPLFRFGPLGRRLLSNKLAAYFLKGAFRLSMQLGSPAASFEPAGGPGASPAERIAPRAARLAA